MSGQFCPADPTEIQWGEILSEVAFSFKGSLVFKRYKCFESPVPKSHAHSPSCLRRVSRYDEWDDEQDLNIRSYHTALESPKFEILQTRAKKNQSHPKNFQKTFEFLTN